MRRMVRDAITIAAATVALAAAFVVVPAGTAFAWTQTAQCMNPVPPPDETAVAYSQPIPSPAEPLAADVFYPPGYPSTGPYPALITVPAGSYQSGCRGHVAPISRRFSNDGFVVFAIDIREDCKLSKPKPALDDPYQCVGTGSYLQPVDDIEAAVLWVRSQAATYNLAGSVATFGDSSTGNQVMVASARGTPGASAADAVVSWSGYTEMRVFADGTPVCAPGDGKCLKPLKNYIGCDPSVCPAKYDEVSPYSIATASTTPTFIANGSTHDTVPYQGATDYDARLQSLGVVHELCSVASDGGDHGLYLADKACTENPETTYLRTLAFLQANL